MLNRLLRHHAITTGYAVLLVVGGLAIFHGSRSEPIGVKWILHEPEKEFLLAVDQLTNLSTTACLSIFGAASYLFFKHKEFIPSWGLRRSIILFLTYIGTIVSYYGAFLTKIRIVGMLTGGALNPAEEIFHRGLVWELYGLLAAIVLLGFLISSILDVGTNFHYSKAKKQI